MSSTKKNTTTFYISLFTENDMGQFPSAQLEIEATSKATAKGIIKTWFTQGVADAGDTIVNMNKITEVNISDRKLPF